MAPTLEQSALLVLIVIAAVLEGFFILRAITEIRTARLYQMLVDDLLRAQRR